jgi:AcrR family transcriptional regulator
MPARAYRSQRRPGRVEATRERIMAAVRALLEEGRFHESTVEEVADRAGISRATLYQHFDSRLQLVDAICNTFAVNPALLSVRDVVEHPDPDAALSETIGATVRFWSSEDPVLSQLYGVVAVDPAARDLVDRQREDRRGEMQRLVRHLRKSGRLRKGLSEARALALLMIVTSYDTFGELQQAGISERELTKTLQESAHELLLRPPHGR